MLRTSDGVENYLPHMAFTIWSVTCTVFMPIGCLVLGMLLSGYETLERAALRACNYRIAFGSHIKFTMPIFLTVIMALAFGGEWLALSRLHEQKLLGEAMQPLEFSDKYRAQLWRHQRNWWVALFSCFIWLIVWRVGALTQYFRRKIALIEKDKIEILKRVAAAGSSELQQSPSQDGARKRRQEEVELSNLSGKTAAAAIGDDD